MTLAPGDLPWDPVETLTDLGGSAESVSPNQLSLFETTDRREAK